MQQNYVLIVLGTFAGLFVVLMLLPFVLGLSVILVDRASARRSSCFFKGRHALITGGSSGIGLACAAALLKKGVEVTIVARNPAALVEAISKLQDGQEDLSINAIEADVTVQHSLEDAATKAEKIFGPISLLICSAGISEPTALESMESSEFERVMKVNWLGVIHSIKAFLPSMKRAGSGEIVLVSSLAGQAGLYGYTAYSSSKFALRGLVEALQMELERYKIRILTAFPPNTKTPLLSRENEMKPEITRELEDTTATLEPEAVADSILAGIRNGNAQIATSFDGWMLNTLTCGMLQTLSIKCLMSEIFCLPLVRSIGMIVVSGWYRKIARLLSNPESHRVQNKTKSS